MRTGPPWPVPVIGIAVAVPDGVVDVRVVVVDDGATTDATAPPDVPSVEAPVETTDASNDADTATPPRTDEDAGAKRDGGSDGHENGPVVRHYKRCSVNDGGVVLRHVDDLRVGWLDDDRLRRLLHHLNLWR